MSNWMPDKRVKKVVEKKIKASPKLQAIIGKLRSEKNEEKKKIQEEEEDQSPASFFAASHVTDISAAYSTSSNNTIHPYSLRDSFLLDCGATIHVYINFSHMTAYSSTTSEAMLYAGSTLIPIDGFGTVELEVQKERDKTRTITLRDVAYVLSFHTSVVYLRRFEAIGEA